MHYFGQESQLDSRPAESSKKWRATDAVHSSRISGIAWLCLLDALVDELTDPSLEPAFTTSSRCTLSRLGASRPLVVCEISATEFAELSNSGERLGWWDRNPQPPEVFSCSSHQFTKCTGVWSIEVDIVMSIVYRSKLSTKRGRRDAQLTAFARHR
jgi:hypothetical protein